MVVNLFFGGRTAGSRSSRESESINKTQARRRCGDFRFFSDTGGSQSEPAASHLHILNLRLWELLVEVALLTNH